MRGIIKKSTGSWYEIWDENFQVVAGKIKGKFKLEGMKSTNPIAVGDLVDYSFDKQHNIAVIENLLPRKNYIVRKSNNLSRQTHVIASNLDLMVILVTVAYPRTSQGFIDRLLINSEAYEIPALIVFNKIDLHLPEMDAFMHDMMEMYNKVGYECLAVSAKKNIGLSLLHAALTNKTILVTGHSGTGKTTLLNNLSPLLKLKTSEISIASLKGKHTTTFAEMYRLGENTFVIDTPGIKEFGMVDMKKEEISHYFPEMRSLIGQCRFNNCLHVNEPECAIIESVNKNLIDPARYSSYLSILRNEDTHH